MSAADVPDRDQRAFAMRLVRLERIGRAYSIIDAKRFALRRCERDSLLPVSTLTRCDPDRW